MAMALGGMSEPQDKCRMSQSVLEPDAAVENPCIEGILDTARLEQTQADWK